MSDAFGPSSHNGSRLRVLIADDNVDAAVSVALLAQLWGYEAMIAYDGADAYRQALAQCPDVVIADIRMPGLDGFQLAQRLCGQMALIAMTGVGEEPCRQRALAAGFRFYLLKPADPQELRRLLDIIQSEKKKESEQN